MVEPIFNKSDFCVAAGKPTTFQFLSTGSGKLVTVYFCRQCGTKLFLSFERFPDIFGVYIGIFDEPNWISIGPDNGRWIYLDSASKGVIIPAGVEVFGQHALASDGKPNEPIIFDEPYLVT